MSSSKHALAFAAAGLLFASPVLAEGVVPDRSYPPSQVNTVISPDMGDDDHNQPSIIDGYLMIAGNAAHELWDISDPFSPVRLSTFESVHADGEAESHQVAFARRDGRTLAVTTSGLGVDLWDLTDAEAPFNIATVELPGVRYGDNTEAVWGMAWQGDAIYVGGTNTGLHVIDASDLDAPTLALTLPISEFGGVSAGPLWAIGNLLVITTPKSHAGVATLDISDPFDPALLDFVVPDVESYIGGFYGGNAYLIDPVRTYDVTSDPTNITLLGQFDVPPSEYMSFADGFAFLGGMRPDPGVRKVRLGDPDVYDLVSKIEGRRRPFAGALTDDQFPLPVGNLLIMADDEMNIGTVIAVHDADRDTVPPEVMYVNPPDGSTRRALTSRVGLSFSDQIDLRSLTTDTIVVRPLGGEALAGSWSVSQTVVGFWPDAPLESNTTYEVLVPAGGVTDLVGNAVAAEFRSTFSTGDDVTALPCAITSTRQVPLDAPHELVATDAGDGATYAWRDGETPLASADSTTTTTTFTTPGRHALTLTVERDGLTRSCSSVVIVHTPATADAPSQSSTIAQAGNAVWVVNPDAGSVTALALDGTRRGLEIAVNGTPTSVAADMDGDLWVVSRDTDTLTVLDGADGALVAEAQFDWGSAPSAIVVDAATGSAWVALEQRGAVARVTRTADEFTFDIIPLGDADAPAAAIRGLAIGGPQDARRVYASRFVSNDDAGEVFVLDAITGEPLPSIALAHDETPDTNVSGRGLPNYVGTPAVSPDGSTVWFAAKKDNMARGLARDGLPMTTTNTVRTFVGAIDAAAAVERDARVDLDDHNMAQVVLPSPLGDILFVLSTGTNQVDVLDAYTGARVAGASTGFGANGLALVGDLLFVNNAASATVGVYDASGLLSGRTNTLPRVHQLTATETDPLDPEVRLGAELFHNADARQLSQDGYISCATCHHDGAQDGRVWDFTDRGEGLRNTIDLRGRAGAGHGPMHWSGNFDEIQDFEHDIRTHFGGLGLMSDADFSSDGRDTPLGAPKAGISAELDALAAYVSTFDTFPRSPFRMADGAMTDEAVRGADIFRSLDCVTCHSGQALTDSALDVRHDVGTLSATSGERLGEPLDGIDTPTLRGVWDSPPYFHDGSAATLRDALLHPGHGNAGTLSDDEFDAVIAFLQQLENEELDLTPGTDSPDAGQDAGADAGQDAGSDGGQDADAATPSTDVVDSANTGNVSGGSCTAAPRSTPSAAWLLLAALALGRVSRNRRSVG